MRELKFRAWNSFNKQMIYPEKHIKDDVMVIRCLSGKVGYEWTTEGGGGVDDDEHLIPMQYTGLKDKNGKEIYEGDIVRVKESELDGDGDVFQVEYCGDRDYPAFDLKDFPDVDSNGLSHCMATCFIEVIGNIYENPELISGQDKSV